MELSTHVEQQSTVPEAELAGRRRYRVLADRVEIEHLRAGVVQRVTRRPLNDPSRPEFLRLPVLDCTSGRSLRTEAFDQWAHHVHWGLEWERAFGLRPRPPRPFGSALAVIGGAIVSAALILVLGTWGLRPTANVNVEPTVLESFGQVLSVLLMMFVIYHAAGAAVRAWLCRAGTYLVIEPQGVRLRPGAQLRPFDTLASARYFGWLRLTRLVFMDGTTCWAPSERGALARLDLVLAALSEPLGDALRASGALA